MLLCRIREVFVIDWEKLNYLNYMKPQWSQARLLSTANVMNNVDLRDTKMDRINIS